MAGPFGLPLPSPRRAAAVTAGATLGAAIVLSGGPATAHQAPAQAPAVRGCGGIAYPAPNGGWGPESVSGCGHAGHHGSTLGIKWKSDRKACLDAQGGDGRWYSLGCAAEGRGSVPWGNTLGMPKVKVSGPRVVYWEH
ncbi:hypothetical protein ACFVH6_12275 [Spirillospora sp. NPDC127200]